MWTLAGWFLQGLEVGAQGAFLFCFVLFFNIAALRLLAFLFVCLF